MHENKKTIIVITNDYVEAWQARNKLSKQVNREEKDLGKRCTSAWWYKKRPAGPGGYFGPRCE